MVWNTKHFSRVGNKAINEEMTVCNQIQSNVILASEILFTIFSLLKFPSTDE